MFSRVFPAPAFVADFPPVAPEFHQCTHRVHLRNLGTTDKKYSHKIRHRKDSGRTSNQQEEIGQWDIFYFVRHGQTIWNVEGKICGATDIALTQLGHEQAIETGKKILEEKIHADEILYSPLMRAADTAKHISGITGIPAREELRLKEQNFGIWGVYTQRW